MRQCILLHIYFINFRDIPALTWPLGLWGGTPLGLALSEVWRLKCDVIKTDKERRRKTF